MEGAVDAVTRDGDVWLLGKHRLICGDARSSIVVDRLMAGASKTVPTTPSPEGGDRPRRGLNDISVLSKSCYGRSLSRDKAVIWRMSAKASNLP